MTTAASALSVVHIGPHTGGMIAARPLDYLDRTEFASYIGACRSCDAVLDPVSKGQVAAVARAADLVVAIKAAGFAVQIDPKIAEMLNTAIAALHAEAQPTITAVADLVADLESRGRSLRRYQAEAVSWMWSRRAGLIADDPGLGKAQPLDARILTPTGWIAMGDVRVGQAVINSAGRASHVTGVFPQGVKDIYRVTFSDGSSTECCDDHLWTVNTPTRRRRGYAARVLPLSKIRARLTEKGTSSNPDGKRLHHVPLVAPIQFARRKALPIDPYLFGLLLGDGGLRHRVTFATNDADLVDAVRSRLPEGLELRHEGRCDYSITSGVRRINPIRASLKKIGAAGKYSYEKSIPHDYLFAGVDQRLELLRGLMDTDGTIAAGNVVSFTSTSEQLARDVRFLVQSLGGTTTIRSRVTSYTHRGERKNGRRSYTLIVAMPGALNPFRLARKAQAFVARVKYQPTRSIKRVDLVGRKPAACISVDSRDSLYVTDDCILTHNTVVGCVSIPKRAPVVILCPVNALGVWVKHLTGWRVDIYPTVLRGRNSFRWPLPGEAVILNYDILPETWGEKKGDAFPTGKKGQMKLTRDPRPGTVIIADEAHAVKSNKARRSKRFRAMVRAVLAADGYAFPMTGTPMLNGAAELWNLLQHIDCAEEAFDDWPTFVRLMGGRKVGGALVWPTDKHGLPIVAPEAAERLRRVMLRRRQCDVLKELPERQHIDLPYVLDETTRKLVDDVMRELQAAGLDIEHALDIATKATGFEAMSTVRKALAISAIPAMLEIVNEIEATGEPQIVASAHRAPIDLLGKRPGWATITGDVDANTRTAIESKFQRGELKGIAMTISAGGVALTLTRAYQMLFVDLMWTPALNKQAEDRICRYGQTKSCLIRRLVGDHELVERVAEKLLEKQRRIDASVEAASVGEGHVAIGGEAAARLQGVLAQVTAIGIAPDGHVRTAPLVENRPF